MWDPAAATMMPHREGVPRSSVDRPSGTTCAPSASPHTRPRASPILAVADDDGSARPGTCHRPPFQQLLG